MGRQRPYRKALIIVAPPDDDFSLRLPSRSGIKADIYLPSPMSKQSKMAQKPARKSTRKPVLTCPRPIVLVGMMGVGKTTIGRRLAPLVNLPFHDADEEIEQAAGMKVSDFFETHGEAAFRDGEARVIKRLLEGPPLVLATGGGAIIRPETRKLIRDASISIWLRAPVDVIADRATRRPTRPLLRNGDPKETIRRLLTERTPFYDEAALLHIDSQTGAHSKTVNKIVELIRQTLKDDPSPPIDQRSTHV